MARPEEYQIEGGTCTVVENDTNQSNVNRCRLCSEEVFVRHCEVTHVWPLVSLLKSTEMVEHVEDVEPKLEFR